MIDPAIISYIKTQLRAGSSQKDISVALAKQGWSALAIAQHFEEVNDPSFVTHTPAASTSVTPAVDNPIAYEKLHPVGATEAMPGVVQASNVQVLERPKTPWTFMRAFLSGYVVALLLFIATIGIGSLIYIGIQTYLTHEMVSRSFMLIAQIVESVGMHDLMPLAYLLPLPIFILVAVFVCRYRGVRIAREEARPYLGFFYASAEYVFFVAVLLAVGKIALTLYIEQVPLPAQAETSMLYSAYYFSIASLFGLGCIMLMLLLVVGLAGARLERLSHPALMQYVFRYTLIVIALMGGLYLTNVLYKPAVLLGKPEACVTLYDQGVREQCIQEIKR